MPNIIFEKKATVLEIICSSVCITSIIVLPLEERAEGKRVFGGQHLFQETAHMLRHRVGARGNATCFLMPWQEILAKLAAADQQNGTPDLPHSGAELANIVRVLLKGPSQDKAKYIADATVRRDVVVELILEMKRRKHKAYTHIGEERVREKRHNSCPKMESRPRSSRC